MDNAEDNHDILNKLCFILFKVSLCPVPTYLRMPKRNICLKIEFFPIILILFYHHFIFSEGPPFLALLVCWSALDLGRQNSEYLKKKLIQALDGFIQENYEEK